MARTCPAVVPPRCGAALSSAYDVCTADALRAASRPLAEARSIGSSALALAATAQTWQLCLAAFVVFSLLRQHSRWLVWSTFASFFLAGQLFFVLWQILMTAFSVLMVSCINIASRAYYVWDSMWRWYRGGAIARRFQLRRRLQTATSWATWSETARELDQLDGKSSWRAEPPDNGDRIRAATRLLQQARGDADVDGLMRALGSMMTRNFEQINAPHLHSECRVGTKELIDEYMAELAASVAWLAAAPCSRVSYRERLQLFERFSVCIGHTALCLSGGGSLAMYHMGVVLALMEGGALPSIVSGTSGGAIVAGVLAIHTDEEMRNDIIKPDIAVRYLPDRWFPPLPQQLYNYLTLGCLVDNDAFERCTKRYYGDTTFEEAFRRTGRVVNINISSSSRGTGPRGALLLNALTTPHVLVRSAVHASCCLPTVMRPTSLLAKGADGQIVPFHGGGGGGGGDGPGVQYMDGSFTADIPRDRLTELFHVTQTVVSQVNPHVVLTMNKHRGSNFSLFRRLESALSADVIYRLQMLAKLRLLPAMYGQDLKSIALKQKYTGDVTILPRIGGPQAVLRMAQNPDPRTMRTYIHEGRAAALAQLSHVQHLLKIEQMLEQATRLCSALASSVGSPASPAPAHAWLLPRNHSRSQLLRMREEHRRSVDRRRPGRSPHALPPAGGGSGEPVSEAALDRLIALAEAGHLGPPSDAAAVAPEAYPALLRRARDQAARLRQAEARADDERRRADRLAEVLLQVGAAAHEAVGGREARDTPTPPQLLIPPGASATPTRTADGGPVTVSPVPSPDARPFPPLALQRLRPTGSPTQGGVDRAGCIPSPPSGGATSPLPASRPPARVARPASAPALALISAPELKPAWAWDGDLPSPIAEAIRPSLEDTSRDTSMDTTDTATPRTSGVEQAGTPGGGGGGGAAARVAAL